MQGPEPEGDPGSHVQWSSHQGQDVWVPGRNFKLLRPLIKLTSILFRFVLRSSLGPLRFTTARWDISSVETAGPGFRWVGWYIPMILTLTFNISEPVSNLQRGNDWESPRVWGASAESWHITHMWNPQLSMDILYLKNYLYCIWSSFLFWNQ